jgi:hypothetical protein
MVTEIFAAALIVSVCLVLHIAGLLLMAEWLLQQREYLERKGARIRYAILMILLFSGIMALHTIETGIWALFYYTRELFNDFETCLYFSLTLCGISTAFIFAVMSAMFQIQLQQRQTSHRNQELEQGTVRSNSYYVR